MVTSQGMNESEMGNRVSKSSIHMNNLIGVKEQRVDGSCLSSKKDGLKCTLMACENRYQIKNLSKLQSNNIKTQSKIHPCFITGFCSDHL